MAKTHQTTGSVNGGIGNIGEMHGDYHGSEGKDRTILELEKRVEFLLNTLNSELHKFHEKLERKDEYIRDVIRGSFERNKGHMARIDKLIDVVLEQNAKIQERADVLVGILEKKNVT